MLSGERRENGIIVAATKAGRDGFWRARWRRAQGIDAYVIHPNSIAVSREPRPPPGQACRAKTDRLDTALLSLEEEDAKRPSRERESLVGERTRRGNRMKSTLARLGIRGFKPTLRTAGQQLERLRTPV